ncbi:MAG TPA: hypothetical protein DDX71_03220 [Ruminococcus sp.]|nr:hypothetical protein [Ruminococcus sp.]
MDLSKLLGQFGLDADSLQDMMQDPKVQTMMNKISGIMTQGGIMPGDVEDLVGEIEPDGEDGGDSTDIFGKMQDLMGDMGDLGNYLYEEIDLDEEVAAYDPQPEDAADRKFMAVLKEWIAQTVREIPAQDVCMLEIGYHEAFDAEDQVHYEIWLAYNTEETAAKNRERFGQEVWNWINWTDNQFRLVPDEPFAAWREAQGYDEANDGDEMIQRIYDLAAAAVIELHKERFTEQLFGRKVPVIIEGYEYYQKTAIRAVKVNGEELFDAAFFSDCGFEPDDEDETADDEA